MHTKTLGYFVGNFSSWFTVVPQATFYEKNTPYLLTF